jgi:CRISPR-associated protein Cmr4
LDILDRFDDTPEKKAARHGSRREIADATLELDVIFGPPTAGSGAFSGALAVTDARILAFPVRSLKGVFAWVTCPAVLDRLSRDLRLINRPAPPGLPKTPGREQMLCSQNSPLLVEGQNAVLEEFEFKQAGELAGLGEWIAFHTVPKEDTATRNRLISHLAVLHDGDFTHFVRHATEVTARIGLDYETKTVKKGTLFYQEFLPPETLFYSLIMAHDSRVPQLARTGQEILAEFKKRVPPILQIGGDETIGKGLCAIRLIDGQEVAK